MSKRSANGPASTTAGAEPAPGRDRMWAELAQRDPAEVQARSGASRSGGAFALEVLARSYRVDSASRTISGRPGDPLVGDPEFELAVLWYLNRARDIPPTGKWVSERDLPGGNLFFRGPHALPAGPVLRRFGSDLAGFRSRCLDLGGRPLEFGDASFAFQALPRVPLACVLYVQDEEFPARLTFLLDSTASCHLPLDVILALVQSLVRLLAEPG
jgi:hypothetical protein